MSVTAPPVSESPLSVLRYLDVGLLVVGAPIMLLIGVSASGYLIAAAVWVLTRGIGVAVERAASAAGDARTQVALRMGFLFGRLFTLAITVILLRTSGGRDAGLAALCVLVFAFTVELIVSALNRPRRS